MVTWPDLVPDRCCKTNIHVILYSEDLNEDGGPIIAFEDNLKCNYQDNAKQVLTPQKQLVQLSGTALFNKDIAPELAVISSGYVEVFEEKRNIYKGTKARNPDGTVNYTRLDLQ